MLAVEDVTGLRGGRVLFRKLSFTVGAGAALALEGANGTGKTSLLRMLAGFLAPAAGTIRFGAVSEPEERGRRVGWLGHHDAVKPQMTVAETLFFFARLHGVADDIPGDVRAALDAVGLARLADLPGQYLSAGQKKRVALARLKLTGRPLWLMDEPLASLDTAGKTLASGLIAAHCAGGGVAVIATHEPLGLDCARLVLS
ncbi:MAG: heme ABC exporter ATP-binding protein CcmA [Alphaproteobacteria bacterium]|nr:heme ABC exporter ATP-binding protein CcmA [Alphaproteobacteria bacterium]